MVLKHEGTLLLGATALTVCSGEWGQRASHLAFCFRHTRTGQAPGGTLWMGAESCLSGPEGAGLPSPSRFCKVHGGAECGLEFVLSIVDLTQQLFLFFKQALLLSVC